MKRRPKTIISTKVEANKDKIYRLQDIHDLSWLMFPNKNAMDLRKAFVLIFLSIKYNPDKKMTSIELDAMRAIKQTDISRKTLWKARAVMARLGMIERRDGIFWTLSSRFKRSMLILVEKVDQLMVPDHYRSNKEWQLLYFL